MSTHRTTATAPPSLVTTPTHIFFYGHELQIPSLTFQQWYPASFDGPAPPPSSSSATIRYPTAEHYMTYQKALTFHDAASAARILAARTPAEANALGRAVAGYDKHVWRARREQVARDGNWLKFSQVDECRRALLDSGDKVIVEASPSDRVWGIGFAADEAQGREDEWGENVLGRALMEVRARLRAQA